MKTAFGRWLVCLLVLAGGPALAQTQPSTAPASQPAFREIKLHAEAVASDEIHLSWYDFNKGVDRYLIDRSDDGGKTFHPVGNEPGGSATAKYEHSDNHELQPETHYFYRLSDPVKGTVYSDVAEATTQARNLLEAVKGESTVKLTDVTSAGFWRATFNAAVAWCVSYVPSLLGAVLIFAIFYVIYRLAHRLTIGSLSKAHVDPTIHDLLLTVLKWGILGFGLVIAGDQVGFHVTALLTGISIMGLAIGFAAQDTLSNLIASVMIFWDKPFKVNDWITLNGQYGKVLRITFRSTRVLNQNGDVIVLSNTAIMGTQLINHTMNPENWVNVPVTVPADVPVARVRAALLATVVGDERVVKDPAPRVVVDSFSPAETKVFLNFCIADESEQSQVVQDYLEKAKIAVDAMIKAK